MNILKISVIIPIYNGSLLISRCLDSVFNQSGNYELEVIVIDDGSTDNSADVVHSYSKTLKYLRQANQGPAAARNRGIETATGQYLAFLDADDYWEAGFLKSTVGFMEIYPEAVAVSVGQMHKIPGKSDVLAPAILRDNPGKYSNPVLLNDFFEFWAEHNHVCTGSVLMRTDIVQKTGGQRPELRITEDLEFWAFLATYGKWGFIPRVLFVSDGGSVTKQIGWLEKNARRWASSPSTEEWERRIVERFSPVKPEGYLKSRGRIARNLSYTMILDGRYSLAQQSIINNIGYLPKDRITRLFVFSAQWSLLWFFVTRIIRFREMKRNIFKK